SLHDRSPLAPLPGWSSAARGGICRSCAGLLPGWPLPGCASVLDAGRGSGVGEGCPRWAARAREYGVAMRTIFSRAADDDAWGLANPLGRAAPSAGSHSRGPGRTPGQGSRSRHALMPSEWSWPPYRVLVVLVKPGVTDA